MDGSYDRLGVLEINDVLPFISRDKAKKEYFGVMINMDSLRLLLFKEKGIKCVCCGLEGKFFAVESSKGTNQWHLNLYAVNKSGHNILMTKDHIIPQSKCKAHEKFSIDNLQPMCVNCNGKKKDKTLM